MSKQGTQCGANRAHCGRRWGTHCGRRGAGKRPRRRCGTGGWKVTYAASGGRIFAPFGRIGNLRGGKCGRWRTDSGPAAGSAEGGRRQTDRFGSCAGSADGRRTDSSPAAGSANGRRTGDRRTDRRTDSGPVRGAQSDARTDIPTGPNSDTVEELNGSHTATRPAGSGRGSRAEKDGDGRRRAEMVERGRKEQTATARTGRRDHSVRPLCRFR